MSGDFPPSSNVQFLMEAAAADMTLTPVGTEPVKESLAMSSCWHNKPPVSPSPYNKTDKMMGVGMIINYKFFS